MSPRWLAWGTALCLLGAPRDSSAQLDARLHWRTLETRHFRIHFHQGLDRAASRAGRVAEVAFDRLTPSLGWEPREVTHIVLSDTTDVANGLASTLPYNAIQLFVTGPADLSPLADYDDWLTELITHELTHVLHLDHVWGIPAVINAVFGKTMSPGQFYPRWFLEGLAVVEESHRTSAGRLRSTMFDMWMRMDVLEDRFLGIDEITDDPRRFPHGNIRYLYGSRFMGYIVDRFGEEAIRQVLADSARQLIPFALNRILRRATGHTYPELYADFRRAQVRRYQDQAASIRARGETPLHFITRGAETALSPRFSPDGRFVYFQMSDGNDRAAIARVRTDTVTDVADVDRLFSVNGDMANANIGLSFDPGGATLVYSQLFPWHEVNTWSDLVRYDVTSGAQHRLTRGARAASPDVAPGGRIAFTLNRAGTSHLAIADRDGRALTVVHRSHAFEQVYTPRWSPDGRRLAFSKWSTGGYRDVWILEVASGRLLPVTHDRAIDVDPAWSPDGHWLYWSSDRTGVANIHALELASGRVLQVTNVLSGAYQPDVSPDGRRLAFVAYRAGSFELATLPLNPGAFLAAMPPPPERPPPEVGPGPRVPARVVPYNPLPTLRPYSWSIGTTQNAFGHRTVNLSTSGADVIGAHSFQAQTSIDPEGGYVEYSLQYQYRGSNPTLEVSHARALTPRRNFRYDDVSYPWVEDALGFSTAATYALNRNFQNHSFGISYDAAHLGVMDEPARVYDPSGHPPRLPETGWLTSVGVFWSYASAFTPVYGVSPEGGRLLTLSTRLGVHQLGSDYFFLESRYSWAEYVRMPWLRHHVLALRAAGGIGASDFSRRGVFALAGFAPMDVIDAVANQVRAPSAVLRGFVPYSRSGDQFHLYNAEYRFPLLDVDRGLYTFPIYLARVWGAFFADYGDAFFGDADPLDWNLGVGGEILVEMVFSYFVNATFRIGAARGLTDRGITDFYVVVGNPF